MGIVYEAEQLIRTAPRRAEGHPGGAPSPTRLTLKMFEREMQTLARLKHPDIAAIYESGHRRRRGFLLHDGARPRAKRWARTSTAGAEVRGARSRIAATA